GGRERPRCAPVARRALRAPLRDQHAALHLLRHVRGSLPRGRHLPREEVRARRLPPRGVHLHQGRTAGRTRAVRLPAGALIAGPGRDLTTVQDEMARLFDGFIGAPGRGDSLAAFSPAVDVEETPEEFVVRADLPGVAQKDVKVSLVGDTLTIRGERSEERKRKDGGYHRVERSHGAFERSFSFGTPVKDEGVNAQVRDGVLEVRVPK